MEPTLKEREDILFLTKRIVDHKRDVIRHGVVYNQSKAVAHGQQVP